MERSGFGTLELGRSKTRLALFFHQLSSLFASRFACLFPLLPVLSSLLLSSVPLPLPSCLTHPPLAASFSSLRPFVFASSSFLPHSLASFVVLLLQYSIITSQHPLPVSTPNQFGLIFTLFLSLSLSSTTMPYDSPFFALAGFWERKEKL